MEEDPRLDDVLGMAEGHGSFARPFELKCEYSRKDAPSSDARSP